MPDPQRLLPLLYRAVDAFRTTAGRRGHVIYLTDAHDVLVAGDLHGNVDNFARLLKVADLSNHPKRHIVLQEVIHGKFRYPGGGDKSHQLLDLIAALKCQFPARVHFLPGNHELSQLTNRLIGKGDEDLNGIFKQGVDTAYGEHSPAVYDAYMQLIAAAPLVVRTPNRVFISHTLPRAQQVVTFDPAVLEQDEFRDEDLIPGGSVHALVWGRSTSEEHVAAFLQLVDADWLITGHVPQESGCAVPYSRQVILDAQASPACYCLVPCDRALTLEDLKSMIGDLN
ncbi:MAG TPA: metallophosphoesterase [Gemmataceae bacterium]|nr:metallophosphoesterase [Gemmataceae bacterium]